VSIIDIHDPTNPRIIANLPLMNSIMGPPVNLAIEPDQHLADSLDWVKDGEGWKGVPETRSMSSTSSPRHPSRSPRSKQASNLQAWRSTGLGRSHSLSPLNQQPSSTTVWWRRARLRQDRNPTKKSSR
jgi:hypothetical protein